MHPKNPYDSPIDFRALAQFYPPLKPLELTKALLKRDFNLDLDLPDNRLCPPVPNRLNYVLWIQDIVSSYGYDADKICGLDIGTGASAIYPLLACSLPGSEHWGFVATEIDPLSVQYARKNININNLSSRITIHPLPVDYEYILEPVITNTETCFDFTMCNPPFYASFQDIESSAGRKEFPPNSICTGAENEMITPGGETTFVLKMLRESCRSDMKYRCRWFTSMLGKLSSVEAIVTELRNLKIDNYALTQFLQGTTRRWAVGWSFMDDRLPDAFSRPQSSSLSTYLPLPTTLEQTFASNSNQLRDHLSELLSSLDGLSFTFTQGEPCPAAGLAKIPSRIIAPIYLWYYTIFSSENSWSRAARRARKREQTSHKTLESSDKATNTERQLILVCRISARANPEGGVILLAQWMKGAERSLFEGFWSHICRKLKAQH